MDAAPTEPMDYSWEFGDGYESLNDIAVHVYDLVGTFDIEVTATSLGNCPATITFPIENAVTVFPVPQAGFEVDPNVVELLTPDCNHHLYCGRQHVCQLLFLRRRQPEWSAWRVFIQ